MNDERQKAVESLVAVKLKRELKAGGPACPAPEVIASYVDQALEAGERARLETHVASCRQCQEAIAALVPLTEADKPAEVALPARRRAFAVWRWAWAAPVLLAVVIVGVWTASDFRNKLVAPVSEPSPAPQPKVTPPPPAAALTPTRPSPSPIEAPAAKPADKKAEAAGPRRVISRETTAEAKTEPMKKPRPEGEPAAADNVTPQRWMMATPGERARVAAPPAPASLPAPPPSETAQRGVATGQTSAASGGGKGAGVGTGKARGEVTELEGEKPAAKPTSSASDEMKTLSTRGALGKEKRSANTAMQVTAAPAMVQGLRPANAPESSPWTLIRTRKAGTWRVGPGGAIQKLDRRGQWMPIPSGVTADLYSVAFFDASEGWAVGQSGTVLRTTDGGKTWAPVRGPITADLIQIAPTGPESIQVTARDGSVFLTTDGGATWNSSPPP